MRAHRFRCYHWPGSCHVDSFEDFDSHWSRAMRFGRPKLKLHRLTHFQNPILLKYAPDWDFGQILVRFWCIFENFRVSRRWLWLPLRRHLHSIPNGWRVCLQSIWSCFERILWVLLMKIEFISQKSAATHLTRSKLC